VRKAIKKGPPQRRQGEHVVERIIRRTPTLTLPKILIKTIPLWTG
jgi:hypothetical protein